MNKTITYRPNQSYFTRDTAPREPVKAVQTEDYDAWGLAFGASTGSASNKLESKYKYNGKELVDDLEIGLYEYGFRWYDAQIAKFVQVDPLADEYSYKSTYDYAENSPMSNTDLDGLEAKSAIDGSNIQMGSDKDLKSSDNSRWNDLIKWENSKTYNNSFESAVKKGNARIGNSQRMKDASGGEMNRDYYSVNLTIPEGYSEKTYYNKLRLMMPEFMDKEVVSKGLKPYSDLDANLWNNKLKPNGAIMSFLRRNDNSDVFVSQSSENHWIFTPVLTYKNLGHPLAGHREFGLTKNENGTFTFYTRGIDIMYGVADAIYNWGPGFFPKADQNWRNVMNKVKETTINLGGKAEVTNSYNERVPIPKELD